MKNIYTKPVLVMESFVMSQSIAHNCGDNLVFENATTKDKNSCGWMTSIGKVFMEQSTCDEIPENGIFNGVCYNSPQGGFNIFNS